MNLLRPRLLALPLLAACGSQALDDDEARDVTPPVLRILEPERGTVQEEERILVRGLVSDYFGVASVDVGGHEAPVREDGSFEVVVPTPAGVHFLQTTARDTSGNESRDTRAVMAGPLRSADSQVRDAMAALLSAETFEALGIMLANIVSTMDFAAVAEPLNPVVEMGGDCLGAEVDVLDVVIGDAEVLLTPKLGGLHFSIELFDVDVDMFSRFAVACVDGSSTLRLQADRVHLVGEAPLGVRDGAVSVRFEDTASTIDELDLDVGVLPDAIVDLANGLIESQVEAFIVDTLEEDMPAYIETFFDEFSTSGVSFGLLGEEVVVAATLTQLDMNSQGGAVVLDSQIRVEGADAPGYVQTRRPLPRGSELGADNYGFRLAVADDMLNQALSAFWASGALDLSLPLGAGEEGSLLGDLVDSIALRMLLPPYASAAVSGDGVDISIGDMLVDVVDSSAAGDEVITRLAVSATMRLGLENSSDGSLVLTTGTPTVWVDVVLDDVDGANVLADDQVELLASTAATRVAAIVGDLVGALPLPTLGGVRLTNTSIEALSGYALLGGDLVTP